MKKVISVVGARPQFIKVAAVHAAFVGTFEHLIIHTGQHYDYGMSGAFFEELGIPEPTYNLEIGSGSPGYQIGNLLIKLEELFLQHKPDAVIVYGDTNSTAAAAIAAAKCRIPLGHVEAGLREFNKHIPEETNKLITDILSDLYFCPTNTAIDILRSMGITEGVHYVGDVMIDLIYNNLPKIQANTALLDKLGVKARQYAFMTCHRASNTDEPANLKEILEGVVSLDIPVIFPIHPRTRKVMAQNNFFGIIEGSKVELHEPMGFIDSQTLIHYAQVIVTDSGGVTKEAYFHKVPGILTDTQTEWVETVQEGWNIQAGPSAARILDAFRTWTRPDVHSNCLGDGKAGHHICRILDEYLNP